LGLFASSPRRERSGGKGRRNPASFTKVRRVSYRQAREKRGQTASRGLSFLQKNGEQHHRGEKRKWVPAGALKEQVYVAEGKRGGTESRANRVKEINEPAIWYWGSGR